MGLGGGGGGGFGKLLFSFFLFPCELRGQLCIRMIPLPYYENCDTTVFFKKEKQVLGSHPPPPPPSRLAAGAASQHFSTNNQTSMHRPCIIAYII